MTKKQQLRSSLLGRGSANLMRKRDVPPDFSRIQTQRDWERENSAQPLGENPMLVGDPRGYPYAENFGSETFPKFMFPKRGEGDGQT